MSHSIFGQQNIQKNFQKYRPDHDERSGPGGTRMNMTKKLDDILSPNQRLQLDQLEHSMSLIEKREELP